MTATQEALSGQEGQGKAERIALFQVGEETQEFPYTASAVELVLEQAIPTQLDRYYTSDLGARPRLLDAEFIRRQDNGFPHLELVRRATPYVVSRPDGIRTIIAWQLARRTPFDSDTIDRPFDSEDPRMLLDERAFSDIGVVQQWPETVRVAFYDADQSEHPGLIFAEHPDLIGRDPHFLGRIPREVGMLQVPSSFDDLAMQGARYLELEWEYPKLDAERTQAYVRSNLQYFFGSPLNSGHFRTNTRKSERFIPRARSTPGKAAETFLAHVTRLTTKVVQ